MSNNFLVPPHLLLSTVAHFSLTPSFLFSLSLSHFPTSLYVCLSHYIFLFRLCLYPSPSFISSFLSLSLWCLSCSSLHYLSLSHSLSLSVCLSISLSSFPSLSLSFFLSLSLSIFLSYLFLYLTCPLLGSSMRLISRNVVLLPLPDGPTMATF